MRDAQRPPDRRHRRGHAAREGRARADQRHGRDARHARPGHPRPALPAHDRGHHGRDERRGPARHGPRVRGRPARAAPAGRPAGVGGEPPRAARRQPDRRQPPRPGGHARAGRVLAALRAAGRRRRAGHARARHARRRSASSRPRSTTPSSREDGRVESNGNFHGAPIAYVLDFLAIAAADVASMAERRTDRFLDVARSHGLPAFLADDPGVDSGYMIAQYTQAALVTEMKRLAVPASVDSIPSSAMQEDHVSMGWSAARKLRTAVDALAQVLAIELLTASRGIQLRAPADPVARNRRRHRRPGHPPRPRPLPRARDRGGHRLRQVRRRAQRRRSDHRRARMKTVIRAARGTELSCRGWQQEAALRMLHNNLDPDVAEHPDELVVYGGTGKAARDWNSLPRHLAARCRRSPTTRRCSCSPASPSASCRRTSGRRAC